MRERDLWQVVAQRLSRRFGWTKTWWAASGKPLGRLQAGLGRGQPDVVGVANRNDEPDVHIVEGKILRPSRHKFNETISQLKDWKDYANFLWAAFARSDWRQLPKSQQEQWERHLRNDGIGLVLVNGKSAEIRLEATRNSDTDSEKHQKVIAWAGLNPEEKPVPRFSLGSVQALAASAATAWCYDIFLTEARAVARADRNKPPHPDYDSKFSWFCWDGWYDGQRLRALTADPLGSMAGNGIPGILVWRRIKTWAGVPDRIPLPGAFFYALGKEESFQVVPFEDLDKNQLEKAGFNKELWIFWQVPIEGRKRSGIRASIQEIWDRIKDLEKK